MKTYTFEIVYFWLKHKINKENKDISDEFVSIKKSYDTETYKEALRLAYEENIKNEALLSGFPNEKIQDDVYFVELETMIKVKGTLYKTSGVKVVLSLFSVYENDKEIWAVKHFNTNNRYMGD